MIAFVFIFIVLLALMFWPQTKQLIPGLADPPAVQPLGNVIDTAFIGGVGLRTQVRTTHKTLLLSGAVELDQGAAVERRTTLVSDQLCVVGSEKCHDIASH